MRKRRKWAQPSPRGTLAVTLPTHPSSWVPSATSGRKRLCAKQPSLHGPEPPYAWACLVEEPWLSRTCPSFPSSPCLALRQVGPSPGRDGALIKEQVPRAAHARSPPTKSEPAPGTLNLLSSAETPGPQERNNMPKAPQQVPPLRGRPLRAPCRKPRAPELTGSTTTGIRPTYGYARRPRKGSTSLQPELANASPSEGESPSVT